MTKLCLHLLAFALLIGFSLVGMIYGWGLEPKNWGWIAFSYIGIFIPWFVVAIAESL